MLRRCAGEAQDVRWQPLQDDTKPTPLRYDVLMRER